MGLFQGSFLPILSPAIILFGITFGWLPLPRQPQSLCSMHLFWVSLCTGTETVLSSRIFKETMMTTGIVMFIVAAANAFSYVLTICKLGNVLTDMAAAMPNAITFIIVVNVLLLILGMFMESTAILIVITPCWCRLRRPWVLIFIFGVAMVLNLMIGLHTAFGMGLFTVSQVAKLPVEKTLRQSFHLSPSFLWCCS